MNGHSTDDFDPTEEQYRRDQEDDAAEWEQFIEGQAVAADLTPAGWTAYITRQDAAKARQAGRVVSDDETMAILAEMEW